MKLTQTQAKKMLECARKGAIYLRTRNKKGYKEIYLYNGNLYEFHFDKKNNIIKYHHKTRYYESTLKVSL